MEGKEVVWSHASRGILRQDTWHAYYTFARWRVAAGRIQTSEDFYPSTALHADTQWVAGPCFSGDIMSSRGQAWSKGLAHHHEVKQDLWMVIQDTMRAHGLDPEDCLEYMVHERYRPILSARFLQKPPQSLRILATTLGVRYAAIEIFELRGLLQWAARLWRYDQRVTGRNI
jgi:hypothetical protein